MTSPIRRRLSILNAIEENDVHRVRLLLEAGADPNTRYEDNEPVLTRAVGKGYIHIVRLLLEAGADPNIRYDIDDDDHDDRQSFTPLMNTVDVDISELLLEAGADPNLQDESGDTVLTSTVGRPILMNQLIRYGAYIDMQGYYGRTALMNAVRFADTENVVFLIEIGADLDLQDRDGNTALHLAAQNDEECYLLLLEAGADPTIENHRGKTAEELL